MRVTQNTGFDAVRDNINMSKSRLEQNQLQSATMKKLNKPSDDPVGAAKILEMRTDKLNSEQFHTNAKLAENHLNNTDHALEELSEIILRAKEIALGQASGASATGTTRVAVAEEIGQLYQQAVSIANRRMGDRYLFGGYKNDKPPFDADGNFYGDDGQVFVEVGKDVFISMNLPGTDVFNTPQTTKGVDGYGSENRKPSSIGMTENKPTVFNELNALRISLLSGDIDGVRNTLETFDELHSQVVSKRTQVGARVQGLQSSIQSMEKQLVTQAELGSTIEDADMAKVMSDIAKEELVLKGTLGASKRLIEPTLMDFLR